MVWFSHVFKTFPQFVVIHTFKGFGMDSKAEVDVFLEPSCFFFFELPRLVGAHYATGDQWRNNSRKNEEMEPKQKQHPVVDVTGDGSKV